MKKIDPHTMTSGDVAGVLDVTITRVHQLDAELLPIRRPNGYRRYNPQVVEHVLAKRSAR